MPPKGYKKANPKPKKVYKQKLVTLISGLEEGYSWFIGAYILETGGFKNRGFIQTRENKENYKRFGYKAKHPEDRGWHLVLFGRRMTRNEISKRYFYKVRKHFGFIPLNKPFKNSVAHHIDKEYVIYIPKLIHKPSHSQGLGKRKRYNMDIVNMKAFGFLLWKLMLSSDYDRDAGLEKRPF